MTKSEEAAAKHLEKQGFKIFKRGWPDFLCLKRVWDQREKDYLEGRYSAVMAVEVKTGKDRLSPDQEVVHSILKLANIPTYVIRPEEMTGKRPSGAGLKPRFITYQDMMSAKSRLIGLHSNVDNLKREISRLEEIIAEATFMFEDNGVSIDDAVVKMEEGKFEFRPGVVEAWQKRNSPICRPPKGKDFVSGENPGEIHIQLHEEGRDK